MEKAEKLSVTIDMTKQNNRKNIDKVNIILYNYDNFI